MNMSYCRFRNTKIDLVDCMDSIDDREKITEEEATAGEKMFIDFLDFCKRYDIIQDFDEQSAKILFEDLRE